MSGTGADACETRLMMLILARLMKLETDGKPLHVWRQNIGAAIDRTGRKITFGEKGASDIMLVVRGRFVGIETKAASGRVSDDQKAWRDKVLAAGGIYIVARCLEDAMDLVNAMLEAGGGSAP